eukprot:10934676-Alexandrium_andersonii.AAC.1
MGRARVSGRLAAHPDKLVGWGDGGRVSPPPAPPSPPGGLPRARVRSRALRPAALVGGPGPPVE